ncbi:PIN domain-containing protein [Actinoplanes sp. TRM 88003]|uniref:Ribonuclease VapC n=1 Tax=Paractinoplanes aksuensis TaxID=2939490 RepID=A0ABT1E1B7_9ACTN|nr:PIN domain-containing protein [Actinoplanes aksuensis]MCO8276931.1 PIN domain-containing protein [Actinoplanes aksuensis]
MKYLVDASALTRILRRQADPAWGDFEERGLLSIAEPVLVEALKIAQTKDYAGLERTIQANYVPVVVPDRLWDQVAVIRRTLAGRSAHHGPSVADLVIAAMAIRLQLTVLHEDADFETVARFVPELKQRRLGHGPPTQKAMSTVDG